VELRLATHDRVAVSVALPDGRTASRSGITRIDVIPTLQALLLLPEPMVVTPVDTETEHPPAESPPLHSDARPATVPPLAAQSHHQAHPVSVARGAQDTLPAATGAERALGVELSILSGARLGDGQYAYGAGALSFLELKSWLIGFQGRLDAYRAVSGGDPETALELGALLGKRVYFESGALDFTAGPAVAMKGLAFSETVAVRSDGMPPPPTRSDPSTGPVPRLLLGARWGFAPRSAFRTFVGVDGELGPARGDPDRPPMSARLPVFSLGLALGGTVGTR
jgi:hypothetical protein